MPTSQFSWFAVLSLFLGCFPIARAQSQTPLGPAKAFGSAGFAVVLNGFPARLTVVDIATLVRVGTFATHNDPFAVAVNVELDRDGTAAFVMHADNLITRLDLTSPTPKPRLISLPASAIPPFYALISRDMEISPDGRYLVATAFDQGRWYHGLPGPRCRASIYDLTGATPPAHIFLDNLPNDLAPSELDIAIDLTQQAWITDGDLNQVVVLDLATAAITSTAPAGDGAVVGVPGSGVGVGAPPPLASITVAAGAAAWVHDAYPGTKPYVRVGLNFQGGYADFPYVSALMFELESRANSPFIAISRPLSSIATPPNPAPDQVILLDVSANAYGITPKLAGSHRFTQIEFFGPPQDGKVVGLDFAEDALFIADFSPWLQNPLSGVPTIQLIPFPTTSIDAMFKSDGLLIGSRYLFHDAAGKLAALSVPDGALLGVVSLVPGELGSSVDLEIAGDLRDHED